MKAVFSFILTAVFFNAAILFRDGLLFLLALMAAYSCWHYGQKLRVKPDPQHPFDPFAWIDSQRMYYDDRDINGLLRIAQWALCLLLIAVLVWMGWK